MKRLMTAIMTIISICSCIEEYNDVSTKIPDTPAPDSDFTTISIGLDFVDCPIIETKSILNGDNIETKVTEVTVAAYDKDGLLRDKKHFGANHTTMQLSVLKDNTYNLYALANMGDMTTILPAKESDLPTLCYKVPTYSDINNSGIPMCGKSLNIKDTDGIKKISLEKLFAKVNVRILHTSLPSTLPNSNFTYNMCNKSVYLRQANTRLFPFSSIGSRALSSSDTIAESDFHADLNNRNEFNGHPSQAGPGPGYFKDTTVVFYIPENVQGKLLTGNTNPYSKTPENINSIGGKDYSKICTYLEFNAKRENTGIGYGGGITYRYYLGEDSTTDFSIRRNHAYDLTLDFTEEGFFIESWKVSKNTDWRDTRNLYFKEKPMIIYKGQNKDVLVHYSINNSTSSTNKPNDWNHTFDEDALRAAGVTYTINKNALVTGPDGNASFCFKFSATNDAKTGATIPLKISTWDGSISDFTTITVTELGNISATWENCPTYVSQEGIFNVIGIPEAMMPIKVTGYDSNLMDIIQVSPTSFKVIAKQAGETTITIGNKDNSQSIRLHTRFQAPNLNLSKDNISINPDGTKANIRYYYTDNTGAELKNINYDVFNRKLTPMFSNSQEWITINGVSNSMELYVSKLTDNLGRLIDTGKSYSLFVKASGCEQVQPKEMSVFVIDPFANINTMQNYGKIDDYSLMMDPSVHKSVKAHFSPHNDRNKTFYYEAPIPNADIASIGAELDPIWANNFSYPCESFNIKWEQSPSYATGASFTVSQNLIGQKHSAGKHNVTITITNKHSLEKLRKTCGNVDIYVHTIIGGYAKIENQKGTYKPSVNYGNFASVYNSIMTNKVYSEKHSYIYYADVSMEYVTPTSGVLIFNTMNRGIQSRQNLMDCLDILSPGVSDKEIGENIVYSVVNNEVNERTIVGGEQFGHRRGIGAMIYRTLLIPGKESPMSTLELETHMLGYQNGVAPNKKLAVKYVIHDMNISNNPELNVVKSREPYYFSPSSCKNYRDNNGRGYHVIHFLDNVFPYSNGWINLL